jgi:D-alanyl-D-alanine-carboxypeptidase/D-alanyl-D-alanine-endopeptidase
MRAYAKLLAAAAMTISAPAAAQEAAGTWVGVIEISPEARLPVILRIARSEAGVLGGTLDSPTQGATDIPLGEIVAADGKLSLEVPAISATYEAAWNAERKAWFGQWNQNGMSWPVTFTAPPPPPRLPADWQVPSDAGIGKLIADRIAPRAGQGLVVGVLDGGNKRVVAGGPTGGTPFDGDTVFEIGSISKVFTALILADMAAKGEVSLDDPAEKYLPPGARMPGRGGKKITLRDLSQHVSGLPRLPDNMPFGDADDPYADYGEAELLAFLARYELPRDIGAKQEYSNFGAGLLGYLLEHASGKTYEALLRERITGPLEMSDTSIALSPDQQRRFAPGKDPYLRPAKPWTFTALAGAGAIRSTADDMLTFASALIDPASAIAPAMKLAVATRVPTENPASEQGLGWAILHPEPARDILMHDGGTGGFRSLLALEPAKGRAVIALANSAAEPSTTDIALRVLAGSPVAPTPPVAAAPPPPVERTEIALPAVELDKFVGRYDLGAGVEFVFTRDGDRLMAQRQGNMTGPALQVFAEAPLAFFYKAIDAQFRFTADAGGKVIGVEFIQGAITAPGKKVE